MRHRAKMFRSDRLSAHDVDYLYSELACLMVIVEHGKGTDMTGGWR